MSGEQFLLVGNWIMLIFVLIVTTIITIVLQKSRRELRHLASLFGSLESDAKSGYKSLAKTEYCVADLLVKLETRKEKIEGQLGAIFKHVGSVKSHLENDEKSVLLSLESMREKNELNRKTLAQSIEESSGEFCQWFKVEKEKIEKVEQALGKTIEKNIAICQQQELVKEQLGQQKKLLEGIDENTKILPKRLEDLCVEIQLAGEKIGNLLIQINAMESKISNLERSIANSVEREMAIAENSQQNIDLFAKQLGSLNSQGKLQQQSLQSIAVITEEIVENIQPILREVKTWSIDPIARKKDLDRRKIAVFIDFENVFISLCKMGLEISDYREFKKFLLDPQNLFPATGRVILFTNKSRWLRKGHYDKNNDIRQNYAKKVKKALKREGIRIVEPDSNVDIPLTLLAIAMAEKSEIEEFVLVANDGTYAGLVSRLSEMGCLVSGILFGDEAAGDLITCYKELGFEKYHIKSQDNWGWLSATTKEVDTTKPPLERPLVDKHKNFNKIAKKFCFVPYRKDRISYLKRAFDLFSHPHSMAQMRAELKAGFPEANAFCRNTIGKILLQSGNIEEGESGKYQTVVKSWEMWLQNAEIAWIKSIISYIVRLKDTGNAQASEFPVEVILREILGYTPEQPSYEEMVKIYHSQICEII